MYQKKQKINSRVGFCLAILALMFVTVASAQDQANCDDPAVRQMLLDAAASGASDEELGLLAQDCNASAGTGDITKGLTVTNNGNVFYEALNACGYHPQAEMVSCDIQVRQTFGFGAFPSGSTEHVLFCFDCNVDGIYEFTTVGNVHVTNDVSGTNPPWQFQAHATTFGAPAGCQANTGAGFNARAILSWQVPPAALPGFNNCSVPSNVFFWGNTVDFMTRSDP